MAQQAAVPAAADGLFLNPVTKNKLILHLVSIIGRLEKEMGTHSLTSPAAASRQFNNLSFVELTEFSCTEQMCC